LGKTSVPFVLRWADCVDIRLAAHAQLAGPGRMNVGASYMFFALRADCVIFRMACTRAAQTACWSVLICFALRPTAWIQAGLRTRRALGEPHECWSVLYFFCV
jgi:hypothetical protein